MANDFWIDDDEEMRCSEEEMMSAHDEYFWHKAQQEQEAHNEMMRVNADMRRKELRENQL